VAFRLEITSQALRDLKSIGQYLRSEETSGADEFAQRLLERAHSLIMFPYRHGVWAVQRNIRKVPFGAYIIFYKIYEDDRVVEILRFWHSARNQGRLRLKEETSPSYQAFSGKS
jgi:toxin ParE1/3/4